jgi:DNA invertase Pin-like site-specific DNA recombinase
MASSLMPAVQYLRMSTEHQQYSLENQVARIQGYAEANGFRVVQTYSDAARSGLIVKRRPGLRQLLKDVVSGTSPAKAILVYDVSRWGRFQDTDESAHYEFICKQAGCPVHYCAETFANDGTLTSLVMKALKRTMAGEYSRELGVKVLAGQRRLAQLGFKQGGRPGYGLRRMLISADGTPKQFLAFGERKSIATDRVILVPGAMEEAQVVQRIYRMLVSDGLTVYGIARRLNSDGIPYTGGSCWDYQAVHMVLTQPKYMGCYVYGRTSSRLYTPSVKLPMSEWVVSPGAFESIIDAATFAQAQRILQTRTFNLSDAQLLEKLRILLAREGRLSLSLVKNSPVTPSPSTYRKRFGSLRRSYELIGYGRSDQFESIDMRRRTRALRDKLIDRIAELFPEDVSIVRRGGRWRTRLKLRNGLIVSVLVARTVRVWNHSYRWQVDPAKHERRCITLLARLDTENTDFFDFHVLPNIGRSNRRFHIQQDDAWLTRGIHLKNLAQFCEVVLAMRRSAPITLVRLHSSAA